MIGLLVLVIAGLVLSLGARRYARFLARSWGEDTGRLTPAARLNDGRDYVPSPTAVVFAHHFASIAGAGPIIGPVIALCYGWGPAVVWVVLGSLLIGGVHDYLATFMAVREGGRSIALVARRLLGTGPFLALMLFLLVTLGLVCATFLNLSATALTSLVPHARLGLPEAQQLFRVVGQGDARQVVIGGIASTSVIVITLAAPLMGWLYIRRQVPVWICSLIAIGICAVSIAAGLRFPVALSAGPMLGSFTGTDIWKLLLAVYVLIAAGVPVWIFLQSRDFINVHILYAGLTALAVVLLVGGLRGTGVEAAARIPMLDVANGTRALGTFWPALFITIACGAVSGFHSLCAGGTTCKQLKSERAVRQVGYWGMILEGFLALSVVAVVLVGTSRLDYLRDVHPTLLQLGGAPNPILSFAMAVGTATQGALGVPVAVGALAGMVLLEGFLVTTLDTAVRLMRYLLEEMWRVIFGLGTLDAQAAPDETGGTDGIPATLAVEERNGTAAPSPTPHRTASWPARLLGHYWVNSAIAVALMLWFAFSGGVMTLWSLFATANQLLAAFALLLGALWLRKRQRSTWAALVPAGFMVATTAASLVLLFRKYTGAVGANHTLAVADVVLAVTGAYLCFCCVRGLWRGE